MKVQHTITIPENDLKKIIAKCVKGARPDQVSFSASENFYGDTVTVSASITYYETIEEQDVSL